MKGFATASTVSFGLEGDILLASRRPLISLSQIPVRSEGVPTQRLPDLLGNVLQFPGSL